MDTINLNIYLAKELSEEDHRKVENTNFISNLKRLNPKNYSMIVSFPRYFYKNNAFLITSQKEVDEVLSAVKKLFENFEIVSCNLTRIDFAFTFIMSEGRTFDSYSPLFSLISLSLEKLKLLKNSKFYGQLQNNSKESFIFTNSINSNSWSKRIIIYNQAVRLKENLKIGEDLSKIIEDFPDLENRMRIEVGMRVDRNIYMGGEMHLSFITEKIASRDFIKKYLLDFSYFNESIQAQILALKSQFDKDGENYNWGSIIINFLKLHETNKISLSKNLICGFIKSLDINAKNKEYAQKIFKKNLKHYFYDVVKDFNDILTQLQHGLKSS